MGVKLGSIIGVITGDPRSLDYSSYVNLGNPAETIVPTVGAPQKGFLILGNPHIYIHTIHPKLQILLLRGKGSGKKSS